MKFYKVSLTVLLSTDPRACSVCSFHPGNCTRRWAGRQRDLADYTDYSHNISIAISSTITNRNSVLVGDLRPGEAHGLGPDVVRPEHKEVSVTIVSTKYYSVSVSQLETSTKYYSLLGGDDLGPLQHGGGAALVRDHAVVGAVEVGVLRKY